LKAKFGQSLGKFINEMANGIDDREVVPYQEPKSIGREITFTRDIDNLETLKSVLLFLSKKLSLNLHSKQYMGKILTIKIRYSDFKTLTKRITLKNYTSAIFDIYKSSLNLLAGN
jgi:DNA polymerase-4